MLSDLLSSMPPGFMMLAALPIMALPHHARQVAMLVAIGASAFSLTAGAGDHWIISLMGFELILYRADHLSLPFAIVFHIAATLNVFSTDGTKSGRQIMWLVLLMLVLLSLRSMQAIS